jgi:hypothetical protein
MIGGILLQFELFHFCIMTTIICFISLLLSPRLSIGHQDTIPSPRIDSALWQFLSMQQQSQAEIHLLNESMKEEDDHFASPLQSEADPFLKFSSFQFAALRFRLRGYDAAHATTLMNGLLMNDPVTGSPGWQLWSGLQSVMKQSRIYLYPSFSDQTVAALGTTEETDLRPHLQRQRLQLSYGSANRAYRHRASLLYASGINPHKWSFAAHATLRYAEENQMAGCAYLSAGYYLAASRIANDGAVYALTLFGVYQDAGRQAGITIPASVLFGNYYNPNWGMQSGKKRNANTLQQHRPVAIASYQKEWKDRSSLRISMGLVHGKRSDTRLDWFNAPDPRPDYYRYLPAFQSDSLMRDLITQQYEENPLLGQVNWASLYETNRNAYRAVQHANGVNNLIVYGKAAHYLVEQRVDDLLRIMLSAAYYQPLGKYGHLSLGGHIRYQRNHYYKIAKDLLEADFHVNWNQFAESMVQQDPDAIQFDLGIPNRIVQQGDRYGHDYALSVQHTELWSQYQFQGKRIDLQITLQFAKQELFRQGYVQNGLFPLHSKGKGTVLHFVQFNPAIAFTYKINGRNFLQANLQIRAKPPAANDLYLSPRMQHAYQDQPRNETIQGICLGYTAAYPGIRARISGFATSMKHGMRISSFYHDGYKNFVNYAISGIDRLYVGMEGGIDWSVAEAWRLFLAASIGQYRYTSRQEVSVTMDNDNWLLEKTTVFSKGFRIPGSPQTCMGAGIQYAKNGWLIQFNANHFRGRWLDINPYRRTYGALEGVPEGSPLWRAIIDQYELPNASLLNLFIGKGMSVKHQQRTLLNTFISISINNLLDQSIISGGYEQLRFDADTKDVSKFPPKLFWLPGRNYSVSLSITL